MELMNTLKSWSTTRNLILSFVASVIVIILLGYGLQVLVYNVYGNYVMPDTRFGYTFEEIQAVFDGLGAGGLQAWTMVHLLDYIFPLVYSFGIIFAMGLELKKMDLFEKYNKILFFPILGCLADYTENILVQTQVQAYPNLSAAIINLANYVTLTKWALLALSFGVILILLFLILYQRLSSK